LVNFLDEFEVDPSFDLDSLEFAIATETALFNAYSENGIPTLKYKTKYKALQFNLNNLNNLQLRRRLLEPDSKLSLEILVRFEPEEMNENKEKSAHALKTMELSMKNNKISAKPQEFKSRSVSKNLQNDSIIRNSFTNDRDTSFRLEIDEDSNNSIRKSSSIGRGAPFRLETNDDANKNNLKSKPATKIIEDVPKVYKRRKIIVEKKREDIDDLLERMMMPKPVMSDPSFTSQTQSFSGYDKGYVGSNGEYDGNLSGRYQVDSNKPLYVEQNQYKQETVFDSKQDIDNETGATIWNGKVNFPQVLNYQASAFQISGPILSPLKFSTLLPSSIFVTGRSKPDVVNAYLKTRLSQSPKPIITLVLSPPSIFTHLVIVI
jgi:hypothetical protein